ncbi:histidine kinase [Mastigocoleus testarum BC008]|uniref:histidine kinase n=1 Tax=Mastigocoleus testarum BC008 TaxID=371196 RepID=A0A0V7ZCA4_9CYAN|nr:histidine kinase [Mastigocoleus testarum BC008]
MLKYSLYELVVTVPSCSETDTVATILKMQSERCDRIIVLNEQQHPIGVLDRGHVVTYLFADIYQEDPEIDNESGENNLFDSQQPISSLNSDIFNPIKILPVDISWENLCLFLEKEYIGKNINLELAIVDKDGKFLGVLDRWELLQRLVKLRRKKQKKQSPLKLNVEPSQQSINSDCSDQSVISEDSSLFGVYKTKQYQSLVQLLERLPWPLMLQTSSGEVVTQNPAWWQQLGKLKNPEGVRREVEEILSSPNNKKIEVEYFTAGTASSRIHKQETEYNFNKEKLTNIDVYSSGNSSSRFRESQLKQSDFDLPDNYSPSSVTQEDIDESYAGHRCFFDATTGTCTCIVQVQDERERERVWQFAKIPLDSQELKISVNRSQQESQTHRTEDPSIHSDLWLVLATDITEQQQLSQELAAKNADLIQLNRLKDEFLACISHELKTPLTAVLGLSRLLIDQQLGKLNERQARYAGLIHQSGRHLMSVVNDILDLTRMETGQMDLTLTTVKIRAVCERAINEAKIIHDRSKQTTHQQPEELASEHQLDLSIEAGLDEIVADELRLRQMLLHLLSNALKFTEAGGEIGLSVSRWEGWIAFNVWDTGIGIPEHQQHLIFQKFQQLENPMTRQFEGTGLGLVLTRALARLHGGDVSFLSNEGQGSNFTLLLPPSPPNTNVSDSEAGFLNATETKSNHHSPLTSSSHHLTSSQRLILVVEPIARYIEDLTKHLRSLGYRVIVARAGCEAVEKARRLQPKAIFLNPFLPLLSGWDVLTLIKSDGETRHIPVIVTATAADKEKAYAKQADAFLSLPVQHQLLAPLLEKFCIAPEKVARSSKGLCDSSSSNTPLRILRLVNSEIISTNSRPSLSDHRVIEVDDLDQAELLARVWKFDVVLLDTEVANPESYLQKLATKKRLASIPLVTCNITNTQAASNISSLSVFPCLLSANNQLQNSNQTNALLSVLQIAAGVCCPPSILVVELAAIINYLFTAKSRRDETHKSVKDIDITHKNITEQNLQKTEEIQKSQTASLGSEWFQALIQYLQTAGFKAEISIDWSEIVQQIRHQNVDLLLICVGDKSKEEEVLLSLEALEELEFNLPPIIILDRRLNSAKSKSNNRKSPQENHTEIEYPEALEKLLGTIISEILPRSIPMEELLNRIYQALS